MTYPILIVSTGRTGTIFFSRLIGELYPEMVAAYHERGFSRPIQILTNAYYAKLLSRQSLVLAWRVLKGQEVKACDKPFHLDANCFLYGLAAIAPNLYPALKVIHLVRDPRTYITSHLNFAKFRSSSFVANYLVPFWQPNPFLTGKISLREYISFSRFQRYGWIWDFKNGVMDSIEHSNTPYLRIHFEDFFCSDAPEDAFAKLTDFIGLPRKMDIRQRFSKRVNQAPKNNFPEWPEWTSQQCRQLQALCGERMRKYGYGNEVAWPAKLESID